MNDVVWAVDSLPGDTDWHKLQLSSCSIAIKATRGYPNEFSKSIIPMQSEKLVPLPSQARVCVRFRRPHYLPKSELSVNLYNR